MRAAVAGNEFDVTILAEPQGESAGPASLLEEAIRADLVSEVPGMPGRYEFSHALVNEVLYGSLTHARRCQLHREVADALVASPGEPALAQTARHFFEAARAPDPAAAARAVAFASAAAHQAYSVFAFEQAAEHLEVALQAHDLSKSDDEIARCRLLVAHADALLLSHRLSESKKHFELAAALARRLRLGRELAVSVLGQTVWNLRPQLSHTADIGALEDALILLKSDQKALRARLMARLATTLTWHSDASPRRQQLSDDAVALAREAGDAHAHALVLADRLWTLWDPDHLGERLRVAAECVERAQAGGARVVELYARGWQLLDLLRSGDLAAANAHLDTYGPFVEEIAQGGFRWAVALFRGTRAVLAGEFDAAEARIQEALEIGKSVESMTATTAYGLQLAALRREQGRLGELKPMIDMLLAADSALPLRWLLPVIHAELKDEAAARATFEEVAARDFNDLPLHDERLGGFSYACLLAEVCGFLQDKHRASILYERLRPYARQWIVVSVLVACFGSVSRVLGVLAATAERWKEAETHFEDALRAHATSPPLLARTQIDYAAALLARSGGRSRGRTQSLLNAAKVTADTLGMAHLRERIELTGGAR